MRHFFQSRWYEDEGHRFSPLTGAVLSGLSAIYGVLARAQKTRAIHKRPGRLPGFVLSIGNLTVGGTGKTPAALRVSEWARNEGYRPAILSRGYGGGHRKGVLDVSDGERVLVGPEQAGDEPYLLARNLTGIPVCVSRNRYHSGLHAYAKYQSNFFILDDGFQHVGLHRDFDLVLLDGKCPLGNGRLLPRGPLREPAHALQRADALVFTRADQIHSGYNSVDRIMKKFPMKPAFFSDHVPISVHFPKGSKKVDPDHLKGKRVVAFTGIARPESFKKTLTGLGVSLVSFTGFPDHYPFRAEDLREMDRKREHLKGDFLVATEKDWVRIESFASDLEGMSYLTIGFSISSGEETFFEMIREHVTQKSLTR